MKQLLLLLPILGLTAPVWQPFAIDKQASVDLPAKPTEAKATLGKSIGHARVWMLRAPEGIYQVMRMPTGLAKMDEAARNSFYEGLIASTMRNEHGQPVLVTAFPTDAGTSLEIKYKATKPGTNKHVIKFMRSMVVDSVAYSLNFIPANQQDSLGLAGAEQRNRFYNSLAVKP